MDKAATLKELETTWSMDDMERANALLDMRQDLEQRQLKRARAKAGN